jgi:hypothetical protein
MTDWFSAQQAAEFEAIRGAPETILLPGLRCPECRRIAYDHGGGRACWKHDARGIPTRPCGVMEPVTLEATVVNALQQKEAQ